MNPFQHTKKSSKSKNNNQNYSDDNNSNKMISMNEISVKTDSKLYPKNEINDNVKSESPKFNMKF